MDNVFPALVIRQSQGFQSVTVTGAPFAVMPPLLFFLPTVIRTLTGDAFLVPQRLHLYSTVFPEFLVTMNMLASPNDPTDQSFLALVKLDRLEKTPPTFKLSIVFVVTSKAPMGDVLCCVVFFRGWMWTKGIGYTGYLFPLPTLQRVLCNGWVPFHASQGVVGVG